MNPMQMQMMQMMQQQQQQQQQQHQQQAQPGAGNGNQMEMMMAQAKAQAAREQAEGTNPAMAMMQGNTQGAHMNPGMQALPDMNGGMPGMDPSAWTGTPGDMAEGSEQAQAVHDAVVATQQAQYLQQVQFLQQVKAHDDNANQPDPVTALTTPSPYCRFNDDYRAFKMCRFFGKAECMQGRRCIYAHCYEELHPASPDMPDLPETEDVTLNWGALSVQSEQT